jgi:hypothetical protein
MTRPSLTIVRLEVLESEYAKALMAEDEQRGRRAPLASISITLEGNSAYDLFYVQRQRGPGCDCDGADSVCTRARREEKIKLIPVAKTVVTQIQRAHAPPNEREHPLSGLCLHSLDNHQDINGPAPELLGTPALIPNDSPSTGRQAIPSWSLLAC